jgi:hypothetical protein
MNNWVRVSSPLPGAFARPGPPVGRGLFLVITRGAAISPRLLLRLRGGLACPSGDLRHLRAVPDASRARPGAAAAVDLAAMPDPVRCADGMVRQALGQWNAYVASGASLEARRARLAEVPEAWREAVRAHLTLVFAMRAAAGRVRP